MVLAFAVVTIAATTALAATVGGRTAVVVAVLMLLSAPGFVALSRNFVFAVPAAAVTMLALYALRRSRWLTSTAWSAAFGVGVGLMPLARTMMISFAPVLLFVAVVHALGHRAPRRRQALNAVLAGVLSVVVAATWLWPSARLVFGYLTEYGYGKHSAEYAGSTALPPVRVLAAFGQDFFAPHLLLIAAGWLLLVVPGRWRRDGRSFVTVLRDVAASPVFPCIGLVLGASAALMTSDNGRLRLHPPAAGAGHRRRRRRLDAGAGVAVEAEPAAGRGGRPGAGLPGPGGPVVRRVVVAGPATQRRRPGSLGQRHQRPAHGPGVRLRPDLHRAPPTPTSCATARAGVPTGSVRRSGWPGRSSTARPSGPSTPSASGTGT